MYTKSLVQEIRELTTTGGKPVRAQVFGGSAESSVQHATSSSKGGGARRKKKGSSSSSSSTDSDAAAASANSSSAPPASSQMPFAFPEIEATDLEGAAVTLPQSFESRVTLVAVSFRQIGTETLGSWIAPLARRLVASSRARNHTKIVQLTILEHSFLRLFRPWILAEQRRQEAKSQEPDLVRTNKLVRIGDTESQRESLGIHNRLAGYVYLVDHEARVRFRASGAATDTELDILFDQTVRLVAEREGSRVATQPRGRR